MIKQVVRIVIAHSENKDENEVIEIEDYFIADEGDKCQGES